MEVNMKDAVDSQGFHKSQQVYPKSEVDRLIDIIEVSKDYPNDNFRQRNDLYAVRNLFHEIPGVAELILNPLLKNMLSSYFGETWFPVKGIYFDKPPHSAWFVNWHQDLTISVDRKENVQGFTNWTTKAGQQAVQPSLEYLENILTARIHLDDADENNGALHVVPGSHRLGVIKDLAIKKVREETNAVVCKVLSGGVMFMKPLTLHASYKSINNNHRRVIHVEFASKELPAGLRWRERI